MTIALGLMGYECLVITADTEETYGSQKYNQGKIASAWRADPAGAICVSGAGDAACIDGAAGEIISKFQSFTGTMDEFESWLKNFCRVFWKKYVMPYYGRMSDAELPEYYLIIGARHQHSSHLWTTTRDLLVRTEPYSIVGISRGSSTALLGQYYLGDHSLNTASVLAAYVIRQAKLSASSVGLDTEIRFIFRDSMGFVPDEKIHRWEQVFAKYQAVQRELLGFISSYIPLTRMLPGAIVPHARSWEQIGNDFESMKQELAAIQVINGLDAPARRIFSPPLTSQKSEGQP